MTFSKEGFKQFLHDRGHTGNTINSYVSGVNQASHHGEQVVWSISDVAALQQIIADFDHGGAYEEIGLRGNNVVINALKRWAEYVESVPAENLTKSYLLTWNPANAKEGGSDQVVVGTDIQWSCHSSQPQVGDTIYIMQLGQNPRGIVAKGTVSQTSFVAPYWADTNKTWRYIKVDIDEVRRTCGDGLLPLLLLERFNDKQNKPFRWTPITSGVEVPQSLATELNTQWQAGRDVHSLRQFIEWTQQDEVNSRSEWLPKFKERLGEIQQLKQSATPIGDDMLEWLWAPPYNGICSVMPGVLPKEAFEKQKVFLRDVAESIRTSPSAETHQSVFKTWKAAVTQGAFAKTYEVVINRVFSAFAAEQYSTIVGPANCKKVLKCLQQEFTLDVLLPDDWPTQNAWIFTGLQEAGVNMTKVAENNVAIWQLFEALSARSKEAKIQTDFSEEAEEKDSPMPTVHSAPLNQIYFGPPGTGKTFITMEAAVRAADPSARWKNRDELKVKYKALADAGRIVFVTFHQSYSYEDFVEGLTASSDSGKIQYAPKNGVFKKLVQKAKDNQHTGQQAISTSFERCWELFLEQLSGNAEGVTITTRRSTFLITEVDDNTIRFDKSSGDSVHSLSVSTLQAVFNQQRVIKGGLQPYYESLISHIKALGEQQNTAAVERQNFVLVIDEINRGNISRIFGELITLIEPSKRLGGNEPLEVVLPLTGDKFAVPDNLYIIGTMNTADRSLAGLDLALRRRFDFIEMPPQPELLAEVFVENIDLELMLKTINDRISVLLDKDHCIGHASFMHLHPDHRPVKAPETASLAELAQVFQHKVLPLLQEYFFEDWQRIAWVLNDQNKVPESAFIRKAAGKPIAELFKGVSQIKARDRWEINQDAFDSVESYQLIYQDETVAQ
ncbi:McrB family protein [Rheinheimera marina]|uniref:McrB family protein n=1 Tax=Rheinheimera marina TaxID=1774958 RepID=A0ABV9JJL1_9GAMM